VFSVLASTDYLCIIFRSPCSFLYRCFSASISMFHVFDWFLPSTRLVDIETECVIWTFLTIILLFIVIFSSLASHKIYNQPENTSILKLLLSFIKLLYDICFEFDHNLTQWRCSDFEMIINPCNIQVHWKRMIEYTLVDLVSLLLFINCVLNSIIIKRSYAINPYHFYELRFRTHILVQVNSSIQFIEKWKIQWNHLLTWWEVINCIFVFNKFVLSNQLFKVQFEFVSIWKYFWWKVSSNIIIKPIEVHIVDEYVLVVNLSYECCYITNELIIICDYWSILIIFLFIAV